MSRVKKLFVFLFLFSFPACAYAAGLSGTNYSQPASIFGAAGGSAFSTSYAGVSSAGEQPVGSTSSINYSANAGGIAVIGMAAEPGSPTISNFRIDGRNVVNNDYIKASGILTANITDETSVDIAASSVEVDGTYTTFNSFTGSSTFDAATGDLTFAFSGLSTGGHTIGINAVDDAGNANFVQYTLTVDTGALKASGVFIFPNPFDPSAGSASIAYRLNNDGNTSIYIFNAVGHLVYKQTYLSGAEGAHVGYNEVTWNGVANTGSTVGNDIYFLRVVHSGKVIGKCKIAVIK